MIHIRADDEPENSKAKMACGISLADFTKGDVYFFAHESRRAGFRDDAICPGCFPDGKPKIGTPLSKLSGRPGHKGYEEFKRIADSWGYP